MDAALKQAIADELNMDPAVFASDRALEDLETWDSVMILSVMVMLSEALGVEIGPEEMTSLRTFGDIETLVAAKTS
jgi:acyl carrier protein